MCIRFSLFLILYRCNAAGNGNACVRCSGFNRINAVCLNVRAKAAGFRSDPAVNEYCGDCIVITVICQTTVFTIGQEYNAAVIDIARSRFGNLNGVCLIQGSKALEVPVVLNCKAGSRYKFSPPFAAQALATVSCLAIPAFSRKSCSAAKENALKSVLTRSHVPYPRQNQFSVQGDKQNTNYRNDN